jgi:4-hydroxy-2-oxoheptanedioate aldolase
MKVRLILVTVVVTLLAGMVLGQGHGLERLNPMIDLMEQGKPVFGLYMPRDRSGAASPMDLAKQAMGNGKIDFLFNGAMPSGFPEFLAGLTAGGILQDNRLIHPIMLKIHKISENPRGAVDDISEQLNLGVSGQMFVEAESAEEVLFGLTAMRYESKGGTRPDSVGSAPSFWGMSEQEYREKADLWPLNPAGELVNWTIIESEKGLVNTREIASVKGIGVLWPGSGTLRGVTSRRDANGERVPDPVAHEASIQRVLAACKEFNVACGIPATPNDIEKRIKQGFSVFVMGWGDAGFEAVDIGRRASGRSDTMQ